MYATYHFYRQTYGGEMPEKDFAGAEVQAETLIRYLTCINGDIFAEKDDRVKLAVCAAADVVFQSRKQDCGAAGIRSESNDGYSVSYVTEAQDGQTAEEVLRRKTAAAVRPYLLPAGWLSRRVQMGGYGNACTDCGHDI